MELRQRKKPLPLQKLDAIIPRLPKNFRRLADMQKDQANRYKGYIGEQKVDYHLRLLARKFTILKDVCLKVDGKTFQIDTIVITPYAVFPIDVKNYDGTITFDTILKQLIRSDGETESGFKYPITQAESHKIHLENWLHDYNFHNIPVHYFVAIAEPSTIIKVKGDEQAMAKVVAHGEHIPQMLLEANEKYAREGRTKLNHRKIGEAILRECTEFDIDLMGKYGVTFNDIMPGVICPGCGWLGMQRVHSGWKCSKCHMKSASAHLRTLADYFLLEPSISNSECMHFLRLSSRNVATRILKKSGLIYKKEHRRWVPVLHAGSEQVQVNGKQRQKTRGQPRES